MAVDTGGLEATSSTAATVRVDCTAPSLTLTLGEREVVEGALVEPPVVEAFDAASGVAATVTELSVDGGAWTAASSPVVAEAGRTYAFRARALDVAGNWSAWRTSDSVVGVAAAAPEEEAPPVAPGEPAAEEIAAPALEAPVAELGAAVEPAAGAVAGPGGAPPPGARPTAPDAGGHLVARLGDPRLRITHVLTRRRHVEIRGTAARTLVTTGHVTVRAGRRAHRRAIRVEGGVWRARVRRVIRTGTNAGRSRVRRATTTRPLTVAVATRATASHAAGTARWRARP